MAVTAVDSTDGSVTYVRDTSKDSKSSLVDSDTFLKLLVAQMKYQDPLSPQDNTQFVSQLAQMSSLQEMQNMTSSLNNSQAYDMIGKVIYAEVLDTTSNETTAYGGVVDSVVIKDGVPYVVVGETAINVEDVKQVFDSSVLEEESDMQKILDALDNINSTLESLGALDTTADTGSETDTGTTTDADTSTGTVETTETGA